MIKIETVDYHDFISGDPVRKAAFVKKLGDAFSEIGFAIVANHGVSEDLKARLFQLVERYFA